MNLEREGMGHLKQKEYHLDKHREGQKREYKC